MRLHNSLFLTSLCLPGALSDFLGPIYPAPRDLTSQNSKVAASWKNLTRAFESSFHGHANTTLSELSNLTFSVGLFSTRDPAAEKLQYHHTSPEVANATIGTRKVDGDSIYRVASVSKLITAYAGMITLDQQEWERPLSETFPELAESLRETSGTLDPVYDNQWDLITPWSLASQMSGPGALEATRAAYGLPPIDVSALTGALPCASLPVCDASSYTVGSVAIPPIALPWTAPIYSNHGYTLLGIAIANLTGKPLPDVYQESIFDPLDMQSSYSTQPPESESFTRGVIGPVTEPIIEPGFIDNNLTRSSGGIYSTLNDLAKFGTGLLNSTLLSPTETRRWMKPVSHTSDLHYSVGAPWEIYRYEHTNTGLITDIYTKLGDSGGYGALSAFLPDFDAGFNVITASSDAANRPFQTFALIQAVIDAVVPALTEQAAVELDQKYAGTYASTTENLNSSITFTAPRGGPPGLEITSWISNGTNLMPLLSDIAFKFATPSYFETGSPPFKLRPMISPAGDAGKIVFRPAFERQAPVLPRDPSNLFTSFYDADDFAFLGQRLWALQYTTTFVFDVEEDGAVPSVDLSAYKVKLQKK
ncbi:serine hydrolase domain-containing protein [Aspergillus undulatus]|uniref:serine hydrolase domain-containing protein n=1 Tax=Aspergillus undulatus TaxID=1810928 RepID=UPI003CCE4703